MIVFEGMEAPLGGQAAHIVIFVADCNGPSVIFVTMNNTTYGEEDNMGDEKVGIR